MKSILGYVLVVALAGIPLWAQDRIGLTVNGYGGAGVGQTSAQIPGSPATTSLDHYTDLELNTRGYLYDYRLVNFFGGVTNGLSSGGSDLANISTTNWNYDAGLNFISERNYPVTVYFNRANTMTSGSLFPTVRNVASTFGVRGQWINNPIGLMTYNFSKATTEQSALDIPSTRSHITNADYMLGRQLHGWDLRVIDFYWKFSNPFAVENSGVVTNSTATTSNNQSQVSAMRQFDSSRRLNLLALYTTSNTGQPGFAPAKSDAASFSGNYVWKFNDRLDTAFDGYYERDHTSAVNVLNNSGGAARPVALPSFDNSSVFAGAAAGYKVTKDLSLQENVSYLHNNESNEQALANAGTFGALAKSLVTVRSGYIYQTDRWKLHWNNTGGIIWQHYRFLGDGTDSILGYSLRQGLSGGDISKVKFALSGIYQKQANPVYFQYVSTRTEGFDARLDTNRFGWIRLSANADFLFNQYDLTTAKQTGKSETYGGAAEIPKYRLSAFAAFTHTNGAQRFFNALPGSGGGTGGTQQPFLPTFLNVNDLTRAGLIWSRRDNLKITSYYNRAKFTFEFSNTTITTDTSWNTLAEYRFGRFTMFAGYARGFNEVQPLRTNLNRWFFRLRFPFHVWQRG